MSTLADGLGLLVLAGLLGFSAMVDPSGAMTTVHWLVAAMLAAGLSIFLWRHRSGPHSLGGWLRLAGLSILLASMFWGANMGLDLIKPPGSRRHDAASTLAGVELWMVFCPGLTAVALAGLARRLLLRASDAPNPK